MEEIAKSYQLNPCNCCVNEMYCFFLTDQKSFLTSRQSRFKMPCKVSHVHLLTLLRLHVTQKALQLPLFFLFVCFFSFSFSPLFLDGDANDFLCSLRQLLLQTCVTNIESSSLDTLAN